MPTPAKTVVLIAAIAVIIVAIVDWRQNIPHQTTAPEVEVMNARVAACNRTAGGQTISMPRSGSTVTVLDTTRRFLTLPRDLYPEENVQVHEQNAMMGKISNGEFASDPKSPCWTHYYEFDVSPGATEGKLAIVAKSTDPAIPDYNLNIDILTH
ncbi:MAG TPA: hypothetical protein VHA78_00205 [Candidatus Peribacteraceae bacterium]|nr:hypothetical protein [Candidatus Peribacteraceae bacterium]